MWESATFIKKNGCETKPRMSNRQVNSAMSVKKRRPFMKRNLDLRGHHGLKLYECISIHQHYKPTKFHQNQIESGPNMNDVERS